MLGAIVSSAVLVAVAVEGDGLLLDLAIVLGLIGFLTSITVARFLESRDGEDR
jgi:multisubunit Na+/H+ antiporter MnhF subunit